MAQPDLGKGTRLAAVAGAWICFEDESGQALQPPKARTWGRPFPSAAGPATTPKHRAARRGSGRRSSADGFGGPRAPQAAVRGRRAPRARWCPTTRVADTPATSRPGSCSRVRVVEITTARQSTPGRGLARCGFPGTLPCSRQSTVLTRPASPAAASQWPMFALTDPAISGRSAARPAPSTSARAASSTGSPAWVPCVPHRLPPAGRHHQPVGLPQSASLQKSGTGAAAYERGVGRQGQAAGAGVSSTAGVLPAPDASCVRRWMKDR